MDRLTSIDASFLTNETASSHMHIGAVLIFEGPPPSYDDLLAHIDSRLHLVPRYRQKLAMPPVETGRPFWVDDPRFNLDYHVRHSALPAPGDEAQLRRRVARVFSQRLDRSKPLWELWLIQGLQRKRFALISKTHHALVDGVSGVDIATVLFDVSQSTEPPTSEHEWHPQPEPSDLELAARGIEGLARTPLRLARRLESAVRKPGATLTDAREAAEGVGDVAWALANPAPDVPLNTPIGPHRRFVWMRARLDDLKRIKASSAAPSTTSSSRSSRGRCAAGCRRAASGPRGSSCAPWSRSRSAPTTPAASSATRSRRSAVRCRSTSTIQWSGCGRPRGDGDVKSSKQALGAEVISRFNDFAPADPARAGRAAQLLDPALQPDRHQRPGPAVPALRARPRLLDVFPIAFLPENHALAIAIMSYNGGINFGLLADYDSMEDVDADRRSDRGRDQPRAATAATAERAPEAVTTERGKPS